MAKIKKTFDRESMYNKIMPTSLKKEEASILDNSNEGTEIAIEKIRSKEVAIFGEEKDEVIMCNITEKLLLSKLDATLKKMNCCRCDRCKEDIKAIALNSLKPMYMVATNEELKQKTHALKDMGSEVTREIIKAVLTVRKNPRH